MVDLLISVITYNESPKRLRETLSAISSKKYSLKTLVVDNGSQDYSEVEAVCRELGVEFHHSSENLGFGGGHNLAFKKGSDGRYFLILNPDLTLSPESIDLALDYLESHPDVGLLSPKIFNPDLSLQHLIKRNPTFFVLFCRIFLPKRFLTLPVVRAQIDRYEMKDVNPETTQELEFASGCCMFVRSEVFKKVKGFDDRYFLYFEDADLTRSVNLVSKTVYYPPVTAVHEWRRANQKKWKYRFVAINSAMKYFLKWGFRF